MTTTVVDEYLHPIDIRDAAVLTRVIDRKIPEADVYQVPFMPLRTFGDRKVKLRIKEVNGAGLAAFKADNALTPIVEGGGVLQEQYIDLVTISEKEVLNATDLIHLASVDEAIAREAARTIVEKGVNLRRRNINRTKWMAWQAIKDELTIVYPNGTAVTVDWDLNKDSHNSWMSGSHLPTAAVDWNAQDASDYYTTDIITDVYTWSKLIADDLGCNESEVILHMNSTTWRYVRRNTWLLRESSPSLPQPRTAPLTLQEAASVLDVADIKIVNDFYLDDTDAARRTKNYFLPDNYLLMTGPYIWQGVPLAEMYDGPVAVVRGDDIVVENNPGMQAEMYIVPEQVAKNIRVTTARMPIVNYPAGFVYAKLVS